MATARDERDQDLVRLYLDEVGRYALLTKAEEAHLGQLVQAGQEAMSELSGEGPLTTARRRQLLDVAIGAFAFLAVTLLLRGSSED